MDNANEPGYYTHLHRHPDGLTISQGYPDGHVDRYNFNTGRPE